MRKFMKHQKVAFDYAKERARIALFMQMRLGKTLVAIRWAEHWKCERTLVVAPFPVLRVWQDELFKEEWAEEDVVLIRGSAEKRNELSTTRSGRWFLINYESLLASPEILQEEWDCIILDESTKIRNPKAGITKLLNLNKTHIPKRAILSGYPAPESCIDYFEQMRFLQGSFMHCHNYWQFRNRYFRQARFEWYAPEWTEKKIKQSLEENCFFLTRKEAGISSKKVYERRFVELNKDQIRLMDQIQKEFEYEHKGTRQETKWVPTQYEWLSRIAGGFTPDGKLISKAKFNEILSLMKGDLRNEPTIIWFKHDDELQFVARALADKNFKVGTFTGSDKSGSAKFMDGRVQILCAQAKCGQYGLDWSRSSTAIYYSNWYDGEVRVQSEDRIIHPKKSDIHLFIDLVTEASIDEDVVGILAEKKLTSKEFMKELNQRWLRRLQ